MKLRGVRIRFVSWATAAALATGPGAAQAQGPGAIQGTIRFTGTPPKNLLISMGNDPNCLRINAGRKLFQELVLVNANGTLANVLVTVKGDLPPGEAPAEPIVIEQKGCVYEPRLSAAMVGQTLRVVNDDATLHNVHGVSSKRNRFNVSQPRAGMTSEFPLVDEEIVMFVRCQVHQWMMGYIAVLPHPYFAITREEGSFRIGKVPAGTYTVEAWHERYGRYSKQVTVAAGQTATVDFAYTGNEPAPGFLIQDILGRQ